MELRNEVMEQSYGMELQNRIKEWSYGMNNFQNGVTEWSYGMDGGKWYPTNGRINGTRKAARNKGLYKG